MEFHVVFKKRLGPWIYQFDIYLVGSSDVTNKINIGTAVVGDAKTDFEVVMMIPKCKEYLTDEIKKKCLQLHRKLGEIIEN